MDLRRRFGSVPSGTHTMTHALRRRTLLVSSALWLAPSAAMANPLSLAHLDRAMASHGAAGATLFAALAAVTCAGALVHLASRRKWAARERQLVNDLTQTRADLDRSISFLASESQILVSWGHAGAEPDVAGDLSLAMEQPAPQRVLAFGAWLPPSFAKDLDRCIETLRARGEGFRMPLVTLSGRDPPSSG